MAEREWIEERWWHRLLQVSGCLVALLSTVLAGLICYAYIDTPITHRSWEKPAPRGVTPAHCIREVSSGYRTINWQCGANPWDLANDLLDAGVITTAENLQVYGMLEQDAMRQLDLTLAIKREGYWVEDTITFREVVASIAITIATPIALGLLMRFAYLFLLYIAHGHTRVRPKS